MSVLLNNVFALEHDRFKQVSVYPTSPTKLFHSFNDLNEFSFGCSKKQNVWEIAMKEQIK